MSLNFSFCFFAFSDLYFFASEQRSVPLESSSIHLRAARAFSGVALRNCIAKAKSNAVLTKLHANLLGQSIEHGFHVHSSRVCERTGWPIDFTIKRRKIVV